MITIFTVPKPFNRPFSIIQTNAVSSWQHFLLGSEIIAFGREKGVSSFCRRMKLKNIPLSEKNDYGTPLVNYVFHKAQNAATHNVLAYINTDIVFLTNVVPVVRKIQKRFPRFLAVGQRYEYRINRKINFAEKDAVEKLIDQCMVKALMKSPGWIDYFIFTKGLFDGIPSFALGRTFWDKWLIWKALSENIPVVDLTRVAICVHQSHDYSHAKGQKGIWEGAEAKKNILLAGGWSHGATIKNAAYEFKNNIIVKKRKSFDGFLPLKKLADCFPVLYPVILKIRYLGLGMD